MSDSFGKLTDEEKKQVESWIDNQVGDRRFVCSICNNSKWMVGNHLVAPPIYSTGFHLGGPAYPQAMVICTVCAHTVFLNAVMVGIALPQKTETEEKGKEGEEKVEHGAEDG